MSEIGHAPVWWADLDEIRPVVVLTRAPVAPRLQRVLAAAVATTVRGIATEVGRGTDEGVKPVSVGNADNIQLIAVNRLLRQAGTLSRRRQPEVGAAVAAMTAG